MKSPWVAIGAVVVGMFLLAIFIVPFFVNADTFRPTVESQLSGALGRNVTLGKLSFSLFEGSLVAEDIAIADDPTFSSVPFIQAKKLDVGVEILPFLFHRNVRITKLNIDTPSIQLIQHTSGKWNFSSIGGSSAPSPGAQQPGSVPNLSVGELKISDGVATVSSIPVTAKPFEYSAVNITVKQFSFDKSAPFDLSAKLPAGGTLKLTGNAGPISQKDTTQTPFHATLTLRDFDVVAAGLIDPSKGISMQNDVDAELTSDGTNVSSNGKIQASRLQLAPKGSPTRSPVEIDYTISDNLNTRQGTVSDLAVHTGSVAVHVNGTFQFTPQAVDLKLHLSAPNLPVDQLEQLLPVVGIRLPSGSSLQGGTLTAEIAITGPATATTMSGPVELDNTKLAGFDLGSKIQGLNPFGGTSSGTQIQVLKATLNSSPESTRITEIYGNLPQIGTATGEGTVAPSGALDFNLNAKLNSSNAVGAIANNAVNAVSGIVGGFLHPKAKPAPASNLGIPLTITGTASSPSIRANIGQMLK
ncbi:MAG TPA: AsmA family protein [Terracidiphilus sp.]|jgi:AsmA protein